MTLKAQAAVYKHTKGNTLYVSIPSKMAEDSQFPFKAGDKVFLDAEFGTLVIKKQEARTK
jgi:hypothetical protein